MKKNLLWAAFTLLAAASCQKNQTNEEPVWEGPSGQLEVRISQPETKVADASMTENKIQTLQVFVFDKQSEKLETDRYVSFTQGPYTLSLTAHTGPKVLYAIVNAPRLKFATINSLKAGLSDLSENDVNKLVMSGYKNATVVEYSQSSGATECLIEVKKLVAAIHLVSVKADFANTSLEGSTFKLKEIYAKNVVGKAHYSGEALTDTERRTAANWYNPLKLDSSPLTLTRDLCNLETATAQLSANRSLYVYPNATTADPENGTGFTARHTRLVLHAVISSGPNSPTSFTNKDYYYTFDLPVLEANKKYEVSVTITMLGKTDDNDDSKTTSGQAQPTITITEWEEHVDLNYDF